MDSESLLWDAAEDPGLNEESLNKLVSDRYAAAARKSSDLRLWGMYTFAGDVVVAMNPYAKKEEMAPLYDSGVMDQFHADAKMGTRPKPHIFGVAAKAHNDICNRNQAIVINGESGAGKTETTKLLINYLIHVAGRANQDGSVGRRVAEMLVHSSPVLEAFGNAKTIRNDNSSRFGKYVRLVLSPEGALCGATVEKYLLEKSRVVAHAEGERSYHAFYYLLHGAPALAEACKLSATSSYRYLTPTGSAAAPADAAACARDFSGVDDGLRALLAASGAVPAAEVAERALFYWRTIAGVLLLGQVQFEPRDEGAGCEIDAPSHAALEAAAALWGCDAAATAALEQALLTRTVQLAGQSSERYPRDAKQARGQADALAKELYDRLFTMVVHEVGGALGEADGGGGGDGGGDSPPGMVRFESSASTDWGPLPHIGLLDIFGFEIFDGDRNGFEQLLINYANDKLQLYFTDIAIAGLTKFYADEIPWRLRKGTDLTSVDGPVRAALLLTEGEEGGAVYNLIDRLNDSALAQAIERPVVDRATGLLPPDKRFVEDLHSYFTGAKPKAGADAPARRAFVQKDGSAWNGASEYRPRKEDVNATEWRLRKQLRETRCHFAISHFGALVPYNAYGWVDTNFDRLDKELVAPLEADRAATDPIASLFKALWQPSATKDRSISEKFRKEVSRGFLDEHGQRVRNSLLGNLKECSGHFIRCIKPNATKAAWTFAPEVASTQLLACGVLAAALVNRTGYPDRPMFDAFMRKYRPAGLPVLREKRGGEGEKERAARLSTARLSARLSTAERRAIGTVDEIKQRVQDLAKRPFPFGYGLRELTDEFAVSTIEPRMDADHTKELYQRMRLRHEFRVSARAKADEPVPGHDFALGGERVFFAPGVLHRIATVLQPRIVLALEKVVVLQCGARVMAAKLLLRKERFSEQVQAEKRRQAEAKRLAEAEEAASKKRDFEEAVAAQLSAESAVLLQRAQAAAEEALRQQHATAMEEAREEMASLKETHRDALAAKEKEAAKLRAAHDDQMEELVSEMSEAAEEAQRALEQEGAAHRVALEETRRAILAAHQERERRERVLHAEEVAQWMALATQRAAVEGGMLEELASDTVQCIAEWRRLRKQQHTLAKLGREIGDKLGVAKSNDGGQAELSEVLVKKGKELSARARTGTMPTAAPLYHRARFFLRAGATLSRSFEFHYEAIELRLAFKSVESYEQAERECTRLLAEHKKALKGGKEKPSISAAMSFRPGAKKADVDGNDELLLDGPLGGGANGELAKLEALLGKVTQLKDEALAARDNLGAAEDVAALPVD